MTIKMRRVILMFTFLSVMGVERCFAQADYCQPADSKATPEARALLERLYRIQKRGTMYGHQDDLMCGHTWWYEPGRSDTKDAVGDYPAVAGFELGEIELGGDRSLDSVAFRDIRERVQWWHGQRGVITVSWHVVNPISSQWPGVKEPNGAGSAWDVEMLSAANLNAVKSILPGGSNHAMFNSWLNRIARFFLTWRDKDGRLIPFIFRPWHEHSGSFFWWGRTRCYDEEYASLWRYTVDFLRAKGLHNILYAYNTDKVYSPEEYLQGYPGDDYIDMLTIDWYGSGDDFNRDIEKALSFTTALARQKHKLHALSECGPISEGLQRILANYESAYLLTWRHAPQRGDRPAMRKLTDAELKKLPANVRENYLRWLKQPRHEDLLKTMKQNKRYLFLYDIQNIK